MVHAVLPWCVGCQDTQLPMLQPPYVEMQSGWSMDVYGAPSGGTGPDRHMLQADRVSQLQYEYYQVMTDSHNVVFTHGQSHAGAVRYQRGAHAANAAAHAGERRRRAPVPA